MADCDLEVACRTPGEYSSGTWIDITCADDTALACSDAGHLQIRRALCPGRVRSCHHPSSHVPGCSFCSFYSFLSIPGAIGSKSVLLDGSLAAPWRLLGGLSLWVATFCTLKKRRVLPFDLHLGRARTDQGRQHTHHIAQLIVSWPIFSTHAQFR